MRRQETAWKFHTIPRTMWHPDNMINEHIKYCDTFWYNLQNSHTSSVTVFTRHLCASQLLNHINYLIELLYPIVSNIYNAYKIQYIYCSYIIIIMPRKRYKNNNNNIPSAAVKHNLMIVKPKQMACIIVCAPVYVCICRRW